MALRITNFCYVIALLLLVYSYFHGVRHNNRSKRYFEILRIIYRQTGDKVLEMCLL